MPSCLEGNWTWHVGAAKRSQTLTQAYTCNFSMAATLPWRKPAQEASRNTRQHTRYSNAQFHAFLLSMKYPGPAALTTPNSRLLDCRTSNVQNCKRQEFFEGTITCSACTDLAAPTVKLKDANAQHGSGLFEQMRSLRQAWVLRSGSSQWQF